MEKKLEFKGDGKIVDLEIELNDGRLSICGTVWDKYRTPKTEKTLISCGQCVDECRGIIPDELIDIWEKWHLNDMRAGCEHQRKLDPYREIQVTEFRPSSAWHAMSRKATRGELSAEEYAHYSEFSPLVDAVYVGFDAPLYPFDHVQEHMRRGYVEAKEPTMKSANWVSYKTHPEGMLSRPCAECGYKYGSAWLKEALPEEVIEYINKL